MSNQDYQELSNSTDCPAPRANQYKEIQLRRAEIGQGTIIKRALPSREQRMIGAWCFLDHAGPVEFAAGDGLDVGPHPHIGLQTFTWMIEGTMMHGDSLGNKQLIRPKQVNLMTAGYGISHTEVAPDTETKMHAAQLWIALPDDKRHMPPNFEHYPELPTITEQGAVISVLVGDFVGQQSPVKVHTAMMGADIAAEDADVEVLLDLNPAFEYAVLALEQEATVNGFSLTQDNMLVLELENDKLHIKMKKGSRLLLIGGEPFETPIVLWWNFVARTIDDMREARKQWVNHDVRFGEVAGYQGKRLVAPELPAGLKPSK